jgi:hypothetical protein
MTFQEAISQLLANQLIRRKEWNANERLGYTQVNRSGILDKKVFNLLGKEYIMGMSSHHYELKLKLEDILASDWEIYVEPKAEPEPLKKKKFFK